jgi:hypothetical protein
VVLAIGLTCVTLLVAAGLTWTARLLRVGGLDAQALAEKMAFPEPTSAMEWPELQIQLVVPEPGDVPTVLLQVVWPAYPSRVAILLVGLDPGEQRALSCLRQWSANRASVVAGRDGARLELRRRQSLERVRATLLAEDYPAAG